MTNKTCARCEKTVYPIEELKCLDKIWHKTCFKCHECGMILNMKTYKGFNKLPYCNAHCPQARATTVAETPESRRLAENTKIQSNVKYHEDFEKQKGKLTQVADDPETLRIRNTTKIISNATYHGEYEKKKQMEERRTTMGVGEQEFNNNKIYNQKYANNYSPKYTSNQMNNNNNISNINQPSLNMGKNSQQHQQQKQVQYVKTPLADAAVSLNQTSYAMQNQQNNNNLQQSDINIMNYYNNNNSKMTSDVNPKIQPTNQTAAYYMMNNQMNHHTQSYPQQHLNYTTAIKQSQVQPINVPLSSHPQVSPQYIVQKQRNDPQSQVQQSMKLATNYHHHQQQQQQQQQPSRMVMYPGQTPYGIYPQSQPHQPQQQHHLIQHQQPQQMSSASSIQNRHQNLGLCFQAIYDYTAQDVDEVTFVEGDVIINCEPIDDGWMNGTVRRTGQTGMLPSNYVEAINVK